METKQNTFEFRWPYAAICLVIGIFGLLVAMLAKEQRRDKVHSALLGIAVNTLINIVFFREQIEQMMR